MRIRPFTRFFLISTAIMSCAFVIMLMTLPIVSNTPPVKRLILNALSAQSGIQIEAEELTVNILPHPKIEMKKMTISEQEAGRQLGSVQGLDVEFQLLPLIFQAVVVTHGTVVKPDVRLTLDSQERSSAIPEASSFSFSSMLGPLHIQALRISEGHLTLSQTASQGQIKLLSWSDVEITIDSGLTTFPIDVRASGTQTDQTGPQGFLLTGKINLEPSWGSHPKSEEAPEGLTHHFTGQLLVADLDLRPMLEFINSEALSSDWSVRGQLETPIDLYFEGPNWSVTFSDIQGQINALHFQGKGNVIGTTGSQPSVFFQGSSSTISFNALEALFLPSWLPQDLHSTLLDHQVEGDLELQTLTWAGSLDEKEAFSVLGVVSLRNVQFKVSPDLPLVKNVSALVGFDSHHLAISEILAEYGASRLHAGHVQIALPNPTPEFTADLRVAWKARDVVNTLITFPPFPAVLLPLRSLENVSGEGELAIRMKGPLTDGSQIFIQEAKVKAHQVGFGSPALPLSIKDWSGTVHWIPNELSIQDWTGTLGDSMIKFSGILSNLESPQLQQGLLHAVMDIRDIRTLFPSFLQRTDTATGTIGVDVRLSGPLSIPNWDGRIDLQNLTLSIPSVMQKPHGVPAWMEFSGAGGNSGILVAHHISLHLPPFAFGGQGKVSMEKDLLLEGTFRSQPVDLGTRDLGVTLGGSGFSPNTLDLSIDLQGAGHDWTRWNIAGFFAASESTVPAKIEQHHPKEMTVQVNLQEQVVNVKFRTERIALGTIMGILGNDSPPLVGDLSLQGNLEAHSQNQKSMFDTAKGGITFLISSGRINHITAVSRILGVLNLPSLLMGKVNLAEEGLPFDRITGTLLVKNGVVHSEDLLVNSPVMKLSGTGNYDLSTDQLNGVVAASPFGAYSDLLKSIPLFGQLLTGERRGLTTALFKVTGSRTDPKVEYQPFESLAGGVQGLGKLAVDVLTNAINIPKRAIEPTKNAPSFEEEDAPANTQDDKGSPQGNY